LSVTIIPASTTSGVVGLVDASPAPVTANSTVTFAVHGVAISANAAAIHYRQGGTAVAAGDEIEVVGTLASGTLNVSSTYSQTNGVLDLGVPMHHDRGGF